MNSYLSQQGKMSSCTKRCDSAQGTIPMAIPITQPPPVITAQVMIPTITSLPPQGAVFYSSEDLAVRKMQEDHASSTGVAFMMLEAGHMRMSGSVILPKTVRIFLLMHGACLDLTRAQFVHPVTHIEVVAGLGGCRVVVPPGVQVNVGGVAVFGGFHEGDSTGGQVSTLFPRQDRPVIHVNGVSLFGHVQVITDYSQPAVTKLERVMHEA